MTGPKFQHSSGFLVCINALRGMEFGIDYEVFRTGEKFLGVKCIPPGLHFVVSSPPSSGESGGLGIRQGFFFVSEPNQVLVREWDPETESLQPPNAQRIHLLNLQQSVRAFELDQSLGLYPQQHMKIWHKLSQYISASVLQRCGLEFECLITPGDPDIKELLSEKELENTHVVPYFEGAPRMPCFSKCIQKLQRDSPAATTMYYHDQSDHLEKIIHEVYQHEWRELCGEFQLSYVLFLQLSSMSALEQWKELLVLLCSCEELPRRNPSLYRTFLSILKTQLRTIAPEFFYDESAAEGNCVTRALSSLFEICCDEQDEALDMELREYATKLRAFVQRRFNLTVNAFGAFTTFAADEDELAPVVVDIVQENENRWEDTDEYNAEIAFDWLNQQQRSY